MFDFLRLHRIQLFPLLPRNPFKIKDSEETDAIFEFSSSRYTGWQILSPNGRNLPKFSIIFQFCYSVHLHFSSEIGRKSAIRTKRTPYSKSAPQDIQVAKSLRPNGQNQLKFSKVFRFAEVVRFTPKKALGRILETCAKRCAMKFSVE